MFFSIAFIAWIGGSLLSVLNGNRRLPSVVLLLGLVGVVLSFMDGLAYFGMAGIAVLAVIIWIANDVNAKNADRTIVVKALCCVAVAVVVLGFGLTFFLTHHKPQLVLLGLADSAPDAYGVWGAFRELPFFISPFVSLALLLTALRLWRKFQQSRRRQN